MIKRWLDTHKWVLAFTLAVSLWQILPPCLMSFQRGFYRRQFPAYFDTWTNNGSFSPIDTLSLAEDNYFYAARIRHAGLHALPGDPYIKENRSARLIARDFLTFYILGRIYRIIGDIRVTWVWYYFIFSLLWVPCLYALLRKMGAKSGPALFTAVLITLFNDLTQHIVLGEGAARMAKAAVQYTFWFLGSYEYWPGVTRLTRPLFTYPCLFLAALALIRAEEKKSRGWTALSGLAGGALAYVHPDVWAGYVGATSLYALHAAWRRRSIPANLAASLLITALASLPWLWVNHSLAQDAQLVGIAYGRGLDIGSFAYLAGAWLAFKRYKREPLALWVGCLLGALFLALNYQLVMGWASVAALWYDLGNVVLLILLGRALQDVLRVGDASWLWMTALALLAAFPRTISYSILHYKVDGLPRVEEEALTWLDRNTPPDSVVAALSPLTDLKIPAHTHNKTMVSFLFPLTSDISQQENARRIVRVLSLYGVSMSDYLKQGLDNSGQWEKKLWMGVVDESSRERSGSLLHHFCNMPQDQVLPLLEHAAQEPKTADYAVDYLWVGRFERDLIPTSGGPLRSRAWEKVFENPAVTILAARRPSGA